MGTERCMFQAGGLRNALRAFEAVRPTDVMFNVDNRVRVMLTFIGVVVVAVIAFKLFMLFLVHPNLPSNVLPVNIWRTLRVLTIK